MALEDFTSYTEVDPNNRFAVTTNKIVVTGLLRNETAYVYSDKGINHFEGDFEHSIDSKLISGAINNTLHFWQLANTIKDWWAQFIDGDDFLSCYWIGGSRTIRIVESDGGVLYLDTTPSLLLNTFYYLTISRDESIGSYGQFKCLIYTDAEKTNLRDTLIVSLHSSKKDFQYIYGAQSLNIGTTTQVTGEQKNLDLQEAIAAAGRRRRMLIGRR